MAIRSKGSGGSGHLKIAGANRTASHSGRHSRQFLVIAEASAQFVSTFRAIHAEVRSQRLHGLEIPVGASVSTPRETENCPSAKIATSAHEVSPAGREAILFAKMSMPGIWELSLDSPTGSEGANPEDRLQRNDSPKAADRPVILKPRAWSSDPALASRDTRKELRPMFHVKHSEFAASASP